MDLILVGPGRAGRAVSLRLAAAGHRFVAVTARRPEAAQTAAEVLGAAPVDWNAELPRADLLILAVRDDAIAAVAEHLAPRLPEVAAAVHLSGATPVSALDAIEAPIGSFHPLQTLPTPEAGAARLEGAWVAVTTEDDLLADRLFALAASAGMRPFELSDAAKPLYHAAAAAAANFPLAALDMAFRLFESAGVPPEAAEPLVSAVVDNAFEMGPGAALTGPVARGDLSTVHSHLEAVAAQWPDLYESFSSFVRAVARLAGTHDQVKELLG